MPWPSKFVDALSRPPYFPRFAVEVFKPRFGTYPGDVGTFRDDALGRISTQASVLQPVTWTHTPGGFSFEVQSDELAYWRAVAVRGSLVKLRVGLGYRGDITFATVGIGRVMGMSTVGKVCTVQCLDLTAALMNRPVGGATVGLNLFGNAGASTTLNGGYTVISGMLTVNDSSGFVKETGGATRGLLRVTSSIGSVGTFYVRWTALSTHTFTVETSGALGTTAGNAASGDLVEFIPYIEGHPIDIARKVLVSTGTGVNGDYDTLPAGWGYGLDDDLVDHADCDAYKAKVTATSGSYSWEVYTDSSQANGTTWLQSILNPAGMWLTTWQGQITVRAATPAYGSSALVHALQIDDDDLVNGLNQRPVLHDTDPSQSALYAGMRVTSGSGVSVTRDSDTIHSFPVVYRKTHSLPYVWTNDTAIVGGDRARLFGWDAVVPERLAGARCAGFRLATLGTGSLHKGISSRRLAGRLENAGETFSRRTALVVTHRVDWTGCAVDVEFALPPPPPAYS